MQNRADAKHNSDYSNPLSKSDIRKIGSLEKYLQEKYGLSIPEAMRSIKKQKPQIPVSIFNRYLSCFEAVVLYLRDYLGLSNKRISLLTARKQNTISSTYKKALGKFSGKLSQDSEYSIPLEVIKDRGLSVLENICYYLRKEYGLSNNGIAELLNLNNKTIWTVMARARKKLHG